MNTRRAIILIGPPGSGKGTQANLLATKLGFYRFEMSKIIEKHFAQADSNDLVIEEEKRKWLAGQLMSTWIIDKWALEALSEISKLDQGIVLEGWPRNLEEMEKIEDIEKYYGKENIDIVEISLSEQESVKRNTVRKICVENRHSIPLTLPEFKDVTKCPYCNSELQVRGLDKPDVIKERYQVYLRETEPMIGFLKNRGYEIKTVNGEQSIEDVLKDILKSLGIS